MNEGKTARLNDIALGCIARFAVTRIINKDRFDDVGPQDADGFHDYAYHGFNYAIAVGQLLFRVRTYDDEPGIATVISPHKRSDLPGGAAIS